MNAMNVYRPSLCKAARYISSQYFNDLSDRLSDRLSVTLYIVAKRYTSYGKSV